MRQGIGGRRALVNGKTFQQIEDEAKHAIESGITYWPDIRGVDDGVRHRVDRLASLGNACVPAQARRAFQILSGLEQYGAKT